MYNLAILGAGNFSRFALPVFLQHDNINFLGVFDPVREKAEAFQSKFGGKAYEELSGILNDDKVNLVYIASPPAFHYQDSKSCLSAGKHVICEKPAALRPGEVQELIHLAQQNNLLYVVNLMQRYNPLFLIVKEIVKSQLLGKFLHGFFENYASDENMPPDHWFWNENKSGGIFIEHAVHFFDLFEGWLGDGQLLSSYEIHRKDSPIEKLAADRVQAVVQYDSGMVNMYHGFDQPNEMDRQEIRLVFERGNINLYEWVPTTLLVDALVTDEQLKAIQLLMPGSELNTVKEFKGEQEYMAGRFQKIKANKRINLKHSTHNKSTVYKNLLYSMIEDQLAWLDDRKHPRRITEQNALNSLEIAEKAHSSAKKLII